MATLSAQSFAFISSSSSSSSHRRVFAALHIPATNVSTLPKLQRILIQNAEKKTLKESNRDNELVSQKMHAILATISDRAEMHAIIGQQRDNWNHLLTKSINAITLTASLMAGMASMSGTINGATSSFIAFKLSSVLLFTAATGMMALVNKIQPSQLAEEQRNSTRLWKQLQRSLRGPTEEDIQETMDKVIALDRAYPLPLLPGMLEKFPEMVEPAQWWPKAHNRMQVKTCWSEELEEEMRGVVRIIKAKDEREYLKAGEVALKVNKSLAILGPIFAGVAAFGSALIGSSPSVGSLPALLGVVGGCLAMISNSLEHCGQIGMVFELLRNCAGYYRRLEEEIEVNLKDNTENGELFELKIALQLGRSLSELKQIGLAASSHSCQDQDLKQFAGKLF